MAKDKERTVYICSTCGHESSKWLGKCPGCNSWNTMTEEIRTQAEASATARHRGSEAAAPMPLDRIETEDEERFSTGMGEMDRVLGGGIVKGSLVLVGGDPGIGKSTLLLQICQTMNNGGGPVLYVTGEESARQVKMRANRLGVTDPRIRLMAEIDFATISAAVKHEKPDLVIIDSIQTMYDDRLESAPGSVSQVRDVTAGLAGIAKKNGIAVFIVGHVTKEGAIAGPRVLEHMVDTVLYFEGERHMNYRILRAVKNRFGSTNEIGIFELSDTGLTCVDNASSNMLSMDREKAPGSVIVSSIEGTRPLLVEVQALVCPTGYNVPRRMSTGFDHNRVAMLLAVLEKKAGMQLHSHDTYVNIVGGLKIDEPACDLGILLAVASSFRNVAIDPDTVVIGEVGLTGEVRPVSQTEKRLAEAARTGFKRCIIPQGNFKALKLSGQKELRQMEIIGVENVIKALQVSI